MLRAALLTMGLWLPLAAPFALAAGPAPAAATVVHAGRLLADPASGKVLERQSVLIGSDGRVIGVEAGFLRPEGARVVDAGDRFVLPGLIDSHVHLTSELGPTQLLDNVQLTTADSALRGAGYAEKTLIAGFTTVADLGADNDSIFALRRAIAEGRVPGPRIVASGAAVTPDGGHGDANGYSPHVIDVLRSESACSGADDCSRVTRRQVQAGADLIKITATGGVLSNTAAGVAQQLTDAEMAAIVGAAHAMGRRVTAHAHAAGGIAAALRAGVDSIEHGTYLDDAGIRLMKQSEAWLVPTMMAGWWVAQLADKGGVLTPAQAEKARLVGPELVAMVKRARAAGVRIAYGTDTGVSPHGMNAREFGLLVEAGYSPLETIRFATVDAAEHLQLTGTAGRIAPGYSADLVAVDGDPLKDVGTLMDMRLVIARGAVHRAP
ncbi:MAG: amidohydrolase family protein [Gammaproteobacteria bacterium]